MKILLFLIHLVTNLCAQYLLLIISCSADWYDPIPVVYFVVCAVLLCLDFFSVHALSRSGKLRVQNPALAHFFDVVLAMPPLAISLFLLFCHFAVAPVSAPELVSAALVLLYEALFAFTRILLYRESVKPLPSGNENS